MKTSLICTVKNESESIIPLLESIVDQAQMPDEVVIVDAGSTDNTVDIIKNYQNKLPLKLIVYPGVNISKGRNLAIKNASYDIICCVDGGCKLDKNWLKNIVSPIQESSTTECVSGVYLPWFNTEFEEVASNFIFPDINKLNVESFQPSARSVAFKKAIWAKIGGFPEELYTAEDTSFDLNLRKIGASFALARDAIVYWRVRSKIKCIFQQIFYYAKGDGIAFLYPQRYFTRYATLFLLVIALWIGWNSLYTWLLLFSLIMVISWFKYLRKIPRISLKRISIGFGVALAIESGTFFGFISGCLVNVKRVIGKSVYKLQKVIVSTK